VSARWIIVFAFLACTACRRDMADQARREPLEASRFFADGASARVPPPHTVARGEAREDEYFHTGRVGGILVTELPAPVSREILRRGQERYDIYCAVCHGRGGEGRGMVVRHGFPSPPSLHEERLRAAPVGHFYEVISHGYGVMYSYASRVEPADRWAIAAYIRALQLSQHATLADAEPSVRAKLTGGAQ
jgi:mono/diheme cytochrome c family protein